MCCSTMLLTHVRSLIIKKMSIESVIIETECSHVELQQVQMHDNITENNLITPTDYSSSSSLHVNCKPNDLYLLAKSHFPV